MDQRLKATTRQLRAKLKLNKDPKGRNVTKQPAKCLPALNLH